jgi:hypothetical protein
MNRQQQIFAFASLVALVVLGRFIPHVANFAPVGAASLMAGYLFRSKWLAVSVPFLGMLVSDFLFAGFYTPEVMAFVYAGLMLPVLLGAWLRKPSTSQEAISHPKMSRLVKLAGASIGSSMIFFVLSNLGTWMFGGMYALNAAGLSACFLAAIPFYKATFFGDLAFSLALFGLLNLASAPVFKRVLSRA